MASLSLASCSKTEEKDKESVKKENIHKKVLLFAKDNGADVDWVSIYEKTPYTVEAQKEILELAP